MAEARRRARSVVSPTVMFEPKYDDLFDRDVSFGETDEEGLPLCLADGEPLSKRQRKKLKRK